MPGPGYVPSRNETGWAELPGDDARVRAGRRQRLCSEQPFGGHSGAARQRGCLPVECSACTSWFSSGELHFCRDRGGCRCWCSRPLWSLSCRWQHFNWVCGATLRTASKSPAPSSCTCAPGRPNRPSGRRRLFAGRIACAYEWAFPILHAAATSCGRLVHFRVRHE